MTMPNTKTGSWYAVGIMTLAYTFSYIDRQIISLMVGPIRADLEISDSEFSLLVGLAFALFYTLLGIPLGRLADASNRRNIIAIGVAFWSLATVACALARNFTQLFGARIAVGIGEAALSPAAYSMLADMFSPKRLGRAIGIYSSGVFIGIGLSFIIGSYLYAGLEARGGLSLPILGDLKPWQATFALVGLPGLLIALLMLTVTEPARRNVSVDSMPLRDVIGYAVARKRVYFLHFLGFAMVTLLFNGIMTWAVEYFIRIHDIARADIGPKLGLLTVIFGGSGIVCGGLYSDFLARRGHLDAPIKAGLSGVVLLMPFAIAAPLVSNADLALVLFAPLLFFVSFPFGPAATGLQLVTPARMRGQMSAVYLFVVNITGIALGGLAVASITDFVFQDDYQLHRSMAIVTAVGGTLAIVLLFLAQKPFRDAIEALNAESTATTD